MTQDGLQSGHPSVQAEVGDALADPSAKTSQGDARGSKSEGTEPYDFERLERAVAFLLKEHERLTSEKSELLEELVEREQRLTGLESQLAAERDRRTTATESVDKILGRLEQLQSSVTSEMSRGMESV